MGEAWGLRNQKDGEAEAGGDARGGEGGRGERTSMMLVITSRVLDMINLSERSTDMIVDDGTNV